MAIFRSIHMTFWADNKVCDDFTPEDKYFYLYLLTNPHTNLCGCYEVGFNNFTAETGYEKNTIERLIDRFENVHHVLMYDKSTKEIMILNWYKYNWTSSEKLEKPLTAEISKIKSKELRDKLIDIYNSRDTVSIPYAYPMHTRARTVTVTDTVTVTNTVNNNPEDERLIASKENFEKIYALYPKKTGKAKALEYYMQWHKGRKLSGFDKAIKLTNKQMYLATMKYVAEKKDSETDLQYYKGFDVFMNKAILDYVDMDGEQT